MASLSPVGIFEEARDRVIGEIDSIVESLNDKRVELLAEIGSLEREFLDRQREKQNDINKLNTLISHTEELGQNTLLDLQQKVIREMRQQMDKLKLDGRQEPNYRIGIKWGLTKAVLIQSINCSDVELTTDTTADCLVLSDATDSSEDNTGLAIQPDSSPDSEGCSPSPVSQISHSRSPEGYRYTPHLTEERHYRERQETQSPEHIYREKSERDQRDNFGFRERPERQFRERPERQFRERPERQFRERPERQFRERPERQFKERPERQFKERPERQFRERPERQFRETPERQFRETPERQFRERPERQFRERQENQFGGRQERQSSGHIYRENSDPRFQPAFPYRRDRDDWGSQEYDMWPQPSERAPREGFRREEGFRSSDRGTRPPREPRNW